EDGIRDGHVTGVQTCALPILRAVQPDRLVWVIFARSPTITHTSRSGCTARTAAAVTLAAVCARTLSAYVSKYRSSSPNATISPRSEERRAGTGALHRHYDGVA